MACCLFWHKAIIWTNAGTIQKKIFSFENAVYKIGAILFRPQYVNHVDHHLKFHRTLFLRPNCQNVSIGSGNGLALAWYQTSAWTNVDKDIRHQVASIHLNNLTQSCLLYLQNTESLSPVPKVKHATQKQLTRCGLVIPKGIRDLASKSTLV